MSTTNCKKTKSQGVLIVDSPRARKALEDTPYLDSLPAADKLWMELFLRATVNCDANAAAILAGPAEPGQKPKLLEEAEREKRAHRRDLMSTGISLSLKDTSQVSDPNKWSHDPTRAAYRNQQCPHCYREVCRCKGKRQRFPRYSPLDYRNR